MSEEKRRRPSLIPKISNKGPTMTGEAMQGSGGIDRSSEYYSLLNPIEFKNYYFITEGNFEL